MTTITQKEIEIILNSTHDGMISVNGTGVVTLCHRAAEHIAGLRAAGYIGRKAVEVIADTRLPIILAGSGEELNRQQDPGSTTIVTSRIHCGSTAGSSSAQRQSSATSRNWNPSAPRTRSTRRTTTIRRSGPSRTA